MDIDLNMQELQAINEKVKELGWNEVVEMINKHFYKEDKQ